MGQFRRHHGAVAAWGNSSAARERSRRAASFRLGESEGALAMDINEFLPPRVAVVEMHGVIGPRVRPYDFTQLLRQIAGNARYRAVVLDIDSPGGSAHASEDIYLAARKLAAKKPLVAAVRGVGASGSYMIACAAERIFAIPTAVIGSIGVISARPMVEELLEKVGVEMIVAKSGRYKDAGSFFRPPTAEERAREQDLIEAVHERFKEIVAEGRPGLDAEQVQALATGEIHLGLKAKALGLIDEIGDLDDAVDWVADRAGIEAKTVRLQPKRSLVQMALSRGASALADRIALAAVEAMLATAAERVYARRLGAAGR